jgi:hypothetical protein
MYQVSKPTRGRPRRNEPKRQISTVLTEEEAETLAQIADEQDLSVSHLVRRWVQTKINDWILAKDAVNFDPLEIESGIKEPK